MLNRQHARSQRVGRIARQNGDFGLAEHFAAVEFFGDDMDRAAGVRVPGGDRPLFA